MLTRGSQTCPWATLRNLPCSAAVAGAGAAVDQPRTPARKADHLALSPSELWEQSYVPGYDLTAAGWQSEVLPPAPFAGGLC